MAGQRALPDLVSRLKLDTSDLGKGEKSAANFSSKLKGHMGTAGDSTDRFSRGVLRLNTHLGSLGPASATVTSRLDQLGLGTGAAEAGILGIGAAAVGAGLALSHDLAESASALNEQLTGSRVVFGDNAKAIEAYAKSLEAAGVSEKDALQATTQIATSLKAIGFTDSSLVRMSTTLTSLATDLSSFSDIPVPEALEALQAALRGEFDPLERFGVHLSAAAVAEEAVREGLAKSTTEVSAGAKAAATYNLILGQTKTQQGDVARSGQTMANQQRALNAELENSKAQIGTGLLPAWTALIGAGAEIVKLTQQTAEGLGKANEATQGWVGNIAKIGAAATPVGQLGAAIGKLADMHGTATVKAADYGHAQATAADLGTKPLTQAVKEQNDALQKNHDLIVGTFNSQIQYEQAQLSTKDAVQSVTKAQTDLNDAIRAHGPASQEAKDAQEALQKAQIDVRQSALQEAQAASELHGKWIQEAGGTQTAAQAAQEEILELQRVRDTMAPGSPLRAYLDQYINKLNTQIPRNITTTVTINEVHLSGRAGGNIGLASGGRALPGRVYTVGEDGPETLVMGRSGGYVIPNGGGPTSGDMTPAAGASGGSAGVTIHVSGAQNPDMVAMAIDRRLSRAFAT